MFKTTKRKVIFVVVFSIICVITTALLIMYNKIEIKQDIEEEPTKDETKTAIKGIDLKGTYNQNDIKIEEQKYNSDKIEIGYVKISGLKDKEIENKINEEIEHVSLNFYKEKVKDINDFEKITISTWVLGNFQNTLSIKSYYFARKSDETDDFVEGETSLNYNLINGEKITVKELFTEDAPIENILRTEAYYSFAGYLAKETLNGDFTIEDYGDIEDKVFEFINDYKQGRVNNFYFSPREITIMCDNIQVSIEMQKYADYIAIYNRCKTDKNIYEDNTVGVKNLYTCVEMYNSAYKYINHQKGSNYYIEITLQNWPIDSEVAKVEDKIINDKVAKIEEQIERTKNIAAQNTNNFYILNYSIVVSDIDDRQTGRRYIYSQEDGNAYEVTVHDFEENLEPIIMEYGRREPAGELPNYVYDFRKVLKIEPQTTSEYYDIETGEKVVI